MAHHHMLDCLVKRLDCPVVLVVKVKVTKGSKLQWMFIRTISPQLIKFGIMMALSWSSVSCITFRVIVRAHIIKYECFYHICWTADFFATTFNRMVPDQAGVFCVKNQIVVFKVMIKVQVQNFIESLCILYLLYHWSLGNQTKCTDLLKIIIKPSTSGHILTAALWLTVLLDTGWGVFCRARWQILLYMVIIQKVVLN